MILYLDDVRDAPKWEEVITVRSAKLAIMLLELLPFDMVSLDHDLGTTMTGYDVAKWIEQKTFSDSGYIPPMIQIHSANPVGRANIQAAIDSIWRIMERRK